MMPNRLAIDATVPSASGVGAAVDDVVVPPAAGATAGCAVTGRRSGVGLAGALGACGAALRLRGFSRAGSLVGVAPAGRWRVGGDSMVTGGSFGFAAPGGVAAGADSMGDGVVEGGDVAGADGELGGGVS
jgi:hypothetical protein